MQRLPSSSLQAQAVAWDELREDEPSTEEEEGEGESEDSEYLQLLLIITLLPDCERGPLGALFDTFLPNSQQHP